MKAPGAVRHGALTSRNLALLSSTVFAVSAGVALWLIYQSAAEMRAGIGEGFNEQQLILARQAAGLIDARLRSVTLELEGLLRYHLAGGRAHVGTVAAGALARGGPAGLRALALVDASGRVEVVWGDPRPASALAALARSCVARATAPPRLGALSTRFDAGAATIEGPVCAASKGAGAAALVDVSHLVGAVTDSIRSGRTGYSWVIDRQGDFLSHADHSFVGLNAFAARHERRPYVSFSAIDAIMKDRMLSGQEGTGTYVSGWHRGTQGEIPKLIAFTPVTSPALAPDAVWSVAVVAPTAEVAAASSRIYSRQLLAQGAVLLALLVFGVTAYSYQRRLSEAERARADRHEEYLSCLLESSADAILFIDNENRVQAWNKGAERIFGYTAGEMTGKTLDQLVPPELDAATELESIRREVEEKGYVLNLVARRRTKDGRRISVDISRTLVRRRRGPPLGSVAIIRDVTEKVELDQRLYNAEKLASIGTLAAGIAHEINNPLAIVLGFADLLLERLPEGSKDRNDVLLIEQSAQHARKVVQQILGFARVSEGHEDVCDVTAAVDAVLSICASTLESREIRVRRELCEPSVTVRGDPRELQQVVLNLVSNSIAAMPGGGELTVRSWRDGGSAHFSVADTGQGIPEAVRPRVFDPFFTTKKPGEGTGLGLSLCYGIVNKHGGRIAFTSATAGERGGTASGTCFTVTLPVARAEPKGEIA